MTVTGDQIANLKQAIAALESQRATLGDAVVDSALGSMSKQLAELQGQPELPPQQRKLATILFTDVVGSTRLGRYLEPDEVLEMMDAALKRLAAAVDQHGGHVTRYQGDGFKAVFGVPQAHENDPEQAVRAGLEILQIAQQIAREWEDQRGIPNFQVRVGINTGLIASGGETEAEDTIMGRAVNLAARLESAAPPGGLLISHFTYRHVRGVFVVDILPPIKAKGFEEPVAVYLVKQAKARSFRVLSRGVKGVETPMVGRETELKYMQDALLTAMEEGEGQVVTVCGEAGVGKSRLLFEFQNWIELLPSNVRLYQGQARLETQYIPYALMRDVFSFRFQIQESDPAQVVRKKIEQGVAEAYRGQMAVTEPARLALREVLSGSLELASRSEGVGDEVEANAHFLGQLLGFDFSGSPHLKAHLQDAQALRNRGMNSLRDYFIASSWQIPVVIFLEDLHWADDSSLEAVKGLGSMTGVRPILLVCLTRPSLYERRPYWGEGQENHRKIELQPLSKRESRQLVEEILQHVAQVPVELRELVVQGAEGNPFYIEELIKMLVERGVIVRGEVSSDGVERWMVLAERLEWEQAPSTLMGVLQARLDSLAGVEKLVLQQAAVVGRIFWDRIVQHIHAQGNGRVNSTEINGILSTLREKELVFRREDSAIKGAQEYIFKHDVLREVTYDTVLVKDRKVYHRLVADWLMLNSGERLGEYYGLVGEHLEMAGRIEEAMGYFGQAGDQALGNYANAEAQGYYQRALSLYPDANMRVRLLTSLGRVLNRQGMYTQAMEHWGEGMQLCRQQDDVQGLSHLYFLAMRASSPRHASLGLQFCQPALELKQRVEESSLKAHLLHQIGRTYYFNGLHDQVAEYCQRALAIGERLGDVEVQADTLSTLALLPGLSKEHCIQYLEQAERLAERHHLYYILGRASNNLGIYLDDIRYSLACCLKSAEAHRRRGDIEGELAGLISAATNKAMLGEIEGAQMLLDYVEERLRFAPNTDIDRELIILTRSRVQSLKGDWANAQESVWQAFEIAEQSNDIQRLFTLTGTLLLVLWEVDRFYQQQDWAAVEAVVNKVLGKSVEGLNSAAYSGLSIVFARQGRTNDAAQLLVKAERQMEEYQRFPNRWFYGCAQIELAIAEKDWDAAVEALERFVKFAEQTGFRWQQARSLLEWGDVCLARGAVGDLDKAREFYQQSLEMFTEMGADGYMQVVAQRLNRTQQSQVKN
jgi:class 3 adenylate cyclase/tetratricopeptide (TPR) repeat protein